ncbi:MAG: protein kinase [Ilumatobacteraceae bacterium]
MANRYLLGKQLGAGGTSRVHAALDERLGRQVAIKLLDEKLVASADPAGRDRFLREGPTSASFSHRNAVTVFDAGEDEGDLYIVMELVDGRSLAEHMVNTGQLPIEEAVDIATQVLAALAAAHAVGIVHRDVKPANVLLGSDGAVKLADFGIAKRFDDLDESVTTTGTVIGTPRYLAPEQAVGATVTAATDVYAMGILLFEMLTGSAPFTGDSLVAIATVQQSQPAPDVRSLRPEVSEVLAATVARALATKPSDRFPTASEMSAALVDADATQVMGAVEPYVVAPRSGGTQVMTQAMAAPTPRVVAPVHVLPTSKKPTSKRAPAMVALVAVLIGVVAVIALLAGRDDGVGLAATPTEAPGATEPALSSPITLDEPLVTEPTASATAVPTTVEEIIPGFAATDDIEVFLEQLEDDPELVGAKGPDLVEKLADLLDKNGKKLRDGARDLREEIALWVEDEDLDPDIAEALDVLLEELA